MLHTVIVVAMTLYWGDSMQYYDSKNTKPIESDEVKDSIIGLRWIMMLRAAFTPMSR